METSANISECFSTICLEKTVDEFLEDQPCTFDQDGGDDWEEQLENFWDGRKHRLSEFEQNQQLSSSLERHLLFDECIQEPEEECLEQKDEVLPFTGDSCSIVRGEDISDVPTQYVINGFKPNEFIVIGTYIDKRVIPGFKYTIRKNLTEKYLFGGKSLRLTQIGVGYGKRLTFEGPSLNNNNNYFWSDSCAAGFGFKLQVVSKDDIFNIIDTSRREHQGRVIITAIEGDQVEKATVFGENGRVEKIVSVTFRCNAVLTYQGNSQALKDISASGTVVLVKENQRAVAEIEKIKLTDFIADGYELQSAN